MKFNLTSEIDIARFRAKADYHIHKKTQSVELTEKRTSKQNNYLHLLLGWFAIESGNTIQYVKLNYYKKLVNKAIFVCEKDDKHLGKVQEIRSSADLNTQEMSDSIERFRNWASIEAGIYLPTANETEFLNHIQTELNKYNLFI